MRHRKPTHPGGTKVFEALQGGDQRRTTHAGWGTAEPIQGARPSPLGDLQEGFELGLLVGIRQLR